MLKGLVKMNEWTLAGDVVSYINAFLERTESLPFGRARLERRVRGGKTRHDIYLDNRDGMPVLTGELKVPDASDGAHPYVRFVGFPRTSRAKFHRLGDRSGVKRLSFRR